MMRGWVHGVGTHTARVSTMLGTLKGLAQGGHTHTRFGTRWAHTKGWHKVGTHKGWRVGGTHTGLTRVSSTHRGLAEGRNTQGMAHAVGTRVATFLMHPERCG